MHTSSPGHAISLQRELIDLWGRPAAEMRGGICRLCECDLDRQQYPTPIELSEKDKGPSVPPEHLEGFPEERHLGLEGSLEGVPGRKEELGRPRMLRPT